MRQLMALAAVLAMTGCGCNLVGCYSGVSIEVQNAPAGRITVSGVAIGGTPNDTASGTCPGNTGCVTTVLLRDLVAPQILVTIVTEAGTRQHVVTPEYRTQQPNGPSCGPTCKSALVRITWQ